MKFKDMTKGDKFLVICGATLSIILAIVYCTTAFLTLEDVFNVIEDNISSSVFIFYAIVIAFGLLSLSSIIIDMISYMFNPDNSRSIKRKELYNTYPEKIARLKLREWKKLNDLKDIRLDIKERSLK